MKEQALLVLRNPVLKRIMVASALALLGCTGDPSGPDFRATVEGFVLEYVDATRTTTRPVVGGVVEVLLPAGQTQELCFQFSGTCTSVRWISQAGTDLDGRYVLTIFEPDHCGLRVRAFNIAAGFDGPADTAKIATAERVVARCVNGGTYDGPTFIIE